MKATPATALRKALGRAIRGLRDAAGYSQEAFADVVGVHRTFQGSVERGETNLSLDNLARQAEGLGLPLSALFSAAEECLANPASCAEAAPARRPPPKHRQSARRRPVPVRGRAG